MSLQVFSCAFCDIFSFKTANSIEHLRTAAFGKAENTYFSTSNLTKTQLHYYDLKEKEPHSCYFEKQLPCKMINSQNNC